MSESRTPDGIAIVGLGLRVPGAADARSFWRNIRDGVESIVVLTEEELTRRGVPENLKRHRSFVPVSAEPEGVEEFDAAFFGFSPREAELMDPQLRLFLEGAWTALEDAGYDPARYQGSIGVAAGMGASDYYLSNVLPNRQRLALDGFQTRLSNSSGSLATLVSYKLDLRGPSFTVQTACSSSLVAVHLACQSLLNGECDLMLAGGVSIGNTNGYLYQEGGILSRDGHCRSFDGRASGTVPGSGVAIVVLKRLSDALADRDTIHAVILGSAVNNDGAAKAGYTAPSIMGHAKVVTEALAVAGVEADTIGLLEAHGTGTDVGDPIEMEGLTLAFREYGDKRGFCAIGSVKTNIGHLDHAAGVAGLIKAVLALENGEIPPSLHFEKPNPRIDFESSPFYVASKRSDWASDGRPRRAGVSSLGIGGTNAHVVVEQAPPLPAVLETPGPELLLVSARSARALDEAASGLARHLTQNPRLPLLDVAHTLHAGRRRFGFRRAIVASNGAEASKSLEARVEPAAMASDSSIAFVFPDTSARVPTLAGGAYGRFAGFRSEVDACLRILDSHLLLDSRSVLFGSATAESDRDDLRPPTLMGPALFTVEYALARLLLSWGLRPEAFIGQGIGELAAASVAGVFRIEEALALVALWARRDEVGAPAVSGALARMTLEKPKVPMFSAATGARLQEDEARDPAYWQNRLQDAARVENGVAAELGAARERVFLVVGPDAAPYRKAYGERAVLPCFADVPEEDGDLEALLRAAGRLWVSGAAVDVEAFYSGRRPRRVPLPSYPFERSRFWLDPPRERATEKKAAPSSKKGSPKEWLYLPGWKSELAPRPRLEASGERMRIVIFGDGSLLSGAVSERLRGLGHDVVEAEGGLKAEDYRRAFDDLLPPDRVVCFNTSSPAAVPGLESFVYLTQALGRRRDLGRIRLFLVGSGLESLGAEEEVVPDRAAALAVCPVIRQEYPSVAAAAIDVRPAKDDLESLAALADSTAAELLRETDELLVALRGRFRHVQAYEAVSPRLLLSPSPLLRDRGTYVITGGLGQIGLVLAEHLARKVSANLALIGRTALPDRRDWERLLTERAGDDVLSRRIRAVLRLESLGSEVLVIGADVADEAQMATAFDAIEARFGGVHGVVHAAGVLDRTTLRDLRSVTREDIDRQFRPKVEALPVLERLLAHRSVDFVLLMSSLSAVLGGVGYGVYAAANAYMDAFAAERQRRARAGEAQWLSVNWDAWNVAPSSVRDSGYGSELSRLALTPSEGIEAFDLALSLASVPRVAISTADLTERIERWARPQGSERNPEAAGGESPRRHPRPALGSVFVAPGNELERRLAGIWGDLLGVEPVGIHDNFFELGGSSLLAIRLMPEVEKQLGVKMATTSIFEGPTIQSFAKLMSPARDDAAAVGAAKGDI